MATSASLAFTISSVRLFQYSLSCAISLTCSRSLIVLNCGVNRVWYMWSCRAESLDILLRVSFSQKEIYWWVPFSTCPRHINTHFLTKTLPPEVHVCLWASLNKWCFNWDLKIEWSVYRSNAKVLQYFCKVLHYFLKLQYFIAKYCNTFVKYCKSISILF